MAVRIVFSGGDGKEIAYTFVPDDVVAKLRKYRKEHDQNWDIRARVTMEMELGYIRLGELPKEEE
jgi:hypothetical protein